MSDYETMKKAGLVGDDTERIKILEAENKHLKVEAEAWKERATYWLKKFVPLAAALERIENIFYVDIELLGNDDAMEMVQGIIDDARRAKL